MCKMLFAYLPVIFLPILFKFFFKILQFEKTLLIKALYICIKAAIFFCIMQISKYLAVQFYRYQS